MNQNHNQVRAQHRYPAPAVTAAHNFMFHNTNTFNAQFYANWQTFQQQVMAGFPPNVRAQMTNNAQANQ